jgi:hypothetical protein
LIGGTTPQGEFASLIKVVFSSGKAIDMVGCLKESDAQAFVDVMNEVRTVSLSNL